MWRKSFCCLFVLVSANWALSSCAMAQGFSSPNPSNYFRQFISNRPTVSPYLNLVANEQLQAQQGTIRPTYQTVVRPMIERRQESQQQQRQLIQMQRQLSDLRSDFQQRSNAIGATGHPTRFMVYHQYYPGFMRLARRR
jgi:hypothetical protein